jgi:hypothetical protein
MKLGCFGYYSTVLVDGGYVALTSISFMSYGICLSLSLIYSRSKVGLLITLSQ